MLKVIAKNNKPIFRSSGISNTWLIANICICMCTFFTVPETYTNESSEMQLNVKIVTTARMSKLEFQLLHASILTAVQPGFNCLMN